MTRGRPEGAVLAFDFGRRRIGIASGHTLTGTAAPRGTILVTQAGPDWAAIEHEIRSLEPAVLVVGAPYNADGTPGALAPAACRFAEELARRFDRRVDMIDERWSSLEANAALRAKRQSGERKRRVRREDIDSTAAAVILERWLAGEERAG